ncbi:protein of Arf GTPase activating protein family, partial [Pseudohyphozyma bogoriensis]
SVVQPTLERVADPTLQSQISSYATRAGTVLTEASRRGGEVLSTGLQSGGELIHQTTGYNAGDLGAGYVDRVTGRGAGGGYAQVGSHTAPTGDSGDDFFSSQLGGGGSGGRMGGGGSSYADASPSMSSNTSSPAGFSDYQSATAPAPTLSSDDTWAKLAPQSAARSGASSRAASGRSSPAVQPKKAAKSDDWDDFGDDWK